MSLIHYIKQLAAKYANSILTLLIQSGIYSVHSVWQLPQK